MSAQLYSVGDVVELDGKEFVVVDIPSVEGKSGTYFSYTLQPKQEYDEAAQNAAAADTAAKEHDKLTPDQVSDAEEGTE